MAACLRLRQNAAMYQTLITPVQLQQLIASGEPLRLFDCSFELTDPDAGHHQFLTQHIPGATHAHLNEMLSEMHGRDTASGGRHPLPAREAFANRLGAAGVRPDMQVVVYDRQGANYCGRLWWMLRWCGHTAVAVLDGGLQAWVAQGLATRSGPADPVAPASQPYGLRAPLVPMVTTSELMARLGRADTTVLDARGAPRFRGETEPLDPVAGHIPGALNRPFPSNLGPDGRFKPAEVLRAEFLALLGARAPETVVHHCGSGVSAIPNVLAMAVAGLGTGSLYAGSWSEWCTTPGAPCASSQAQPPAASADTPLKH